MTSSDYLYVGGQEPFNAIKLSLANGENQTNSVTLSAEYWDGSQWKSLTITDGTQISGKCLNQTGFIRWTSPSDWRDCSPLSHALTQAWWVRLKPSGTLSSTVSVTEARIAIQPDDLEKHRFTSSVDNRVLLASTLAQKDKVALSRQYEEYGWTGSDAYSARLGSQDAITACVKFFDNVWLAKGADWYSIGQGLSISRMDSGGQSPVNNQCCVVAPLDGAGVQNSPFISSDQSRMAVYFVNYAGVWCIGAAGVRNITGNVQWFVSADNPRIDKDALASCCGVYWPAKGWILWAVPMIQGSATSQSTNNALIVYDITSSAWLPYFSIPAVSLTTACEYASAHPEHLGDLALLAGGYDGKVMRLFNDATQDSGSAIPAYVETGWMFFDAPNIEKILRSAFVYGSIDAGDLIVQVRIDGEEETAASRVFAVSSLSSAAGEYMVDFAHKNITARAFKFIFSWTGPGSIYGCSLELAPVRTWPGT